MSGERVVVAATFLSGNFTFRGVGMLSIHMCKVLVPIGLDVNEEGKGMGEERREEA